MPSALSDPFPYMLLKLRWSQLSLAHVATPIAKQACSGDIGGGIAAAVFSRQQMFGCTLKQTGLFSGDSLLGCKLSWARKPHQLVAVDAKASLMQKCGSTDVLEIVGHTSSLVRETRSLVELRGNQQA